MKLLYHNVTNQQSCWLAADDSYPIERSCLKQVQQVSDLPFNKFVATPDLHTGPGIPNGFVLDSERIYPHLIGSDIGCGMRLVILQGISREEIESLAPKLEQVLLRKFFQGERALVLTSQDRRNLMLQGVAAIGDSVSPSNPYFNDLNWDNQVDCSYFVREATSLPNCIHPYLSRSGPDPQLGSLGGGNYFCEFVEFQNIVQPQAAYSYRVENKQTGILVHSGSLAVGKAASHEMNHRPEDYQTAVANFAWYNRFALAQMAHWALEETAQKKIATHLVYDSPHNFIEKVGDLYRHRKGATPSPGITSVHPWGVPVLVPGSMGSYSYLLASTENREALLSAPHGAGRSISRNRLRHSPVLVDDSRVVNPMKPFVNSSSHLKKEYLKRLSEESTDAYKSIESVVAQVEGQGTARKVTKLVPIMTVKG